MLCFQPMFVFSDIGLFIAWPHKLFLSIHKNKFQPPQVHRFYAIKSKEISTEWKYNILKIYWKYSITIHEKCPKCKEDRGINLSWAEVFSAINPFLTSGDNRSHILETHLQQKFSGLFCVTFLLRLISTHPYCSWLISSQSWHKWFIHKRGLKSINKKSFRYLTLLHIFLKTALSWVEY